MESLIAAEENSAVLQLLLLACRSGFTYEAEVGFLRISVQQGSVKIQEGNKTKEKSISEFRDVLERLSL
ncbi:hypothetical protein C8_465 [Cannes 8 virus]|nr:hypothetical protein C8_465 [Cannes 8 virus]ANB78282.1 hypothetical protein MEL_390b [Melbournevirus]AVR53162.1 hypothetical protein MarSH_457 [Marseillevirus Shanghai 1]